MIGLLRVEWTRFMLRRAIVAVLLLGVAVTVAMAFKTAWDTRPASDSDLATAQAQSELAAKEAANAATVVECERDPVAMLGPGAKKADCAARLLPSPESLLKRQPLDFTVALDREGARLAAFLACLLVIAGATFAGADWGTGSLTTQLMFEPRRLRLMAAKAIVTALAGTLFMLLCLAGFWLALLLVAEARGVVVPDADLSLVGWHVMRAVALGGAATLGAFALTMLFRHTVATLALLFVYAAGSEFLVTLSPIPGIARWSIGNNVFGWLKPDFEYVEVTGKCAAYRECNPVQTLSHLDSGLFLLALLVIAVLASAVVFRHRDV